MTLRIAVITPFYPSVPESTDGLFVKFQVDALRKLGCSVDTYLIKPLRPRELRRQPLLTFDDAPPAVPSLSIRGRMCWCASLPDYRLHGLALASAVVGMCVRSAGPIRAGGVDAFIGHAEFSGMVAAVLGGTYGVPSLTVAHGMATNTRAYDLRTTRWVTTTAYAKADGVVVVGSNLLDHVRGLGAKPEQTYFIPNGIDVMPRAELDSTALPPKTRPWIVSVSNLWGTKGVDVNLRALARLRDRGLDCEYHVIGEGEEAGRLMRLTTDLRLSDRVAFHGRLPRPQSLTYVRSADVFSLPSAVEAFGIVYGEAMAYGVPVIGCRGQGIEDVLGACRAGILVPRGDPVATAVAIESILTSRDAAQAFGAQGVRRARELTWQRNAEALLGCLAEAIRGRVPARASGRS